MVLEVAMLNVKPRLSDDFEAAFSQAQMIISSMKRYVSHQLQRCLEKSGRYILSGAWESLEDHTLGFRGSPEDQEWRRLLHHFYDPFPDVEHYQVVRADYGM
jgi:heme-degrading monooxygenase HmoA